MKSVNIWKTQKTQWIFSKWSMILVKEPSKHKIDKWILMKNLEKFIGVISDSTLQLTCKKLLLAVSKKNIHNSLKGL